MTTALASLSRGNVRKALSEHPLAICTAVHFGILLWAGCSESLMLVRPGQADKVVAASNRILSVGLISAWVAKLIGARS